MSYPDLKQKEKSDDDICLIFYTRRIWSAMENGREKIFVIQCLCLLQIFFTWYEVLVMLIFLFWLLVRKKQQPEKPTQPLVQYTL